MTEQTLNKTRGLGAHQVVLPTSYDRIQADRQRKKGFISSWFTSLKQAESVGFFAPKRWEFWRCLLLCFALFCMVGHWLEIPYCTFMDQFGIVEEDYNVWLDPWYVPYWVYGIGAAVMTLLIEPLKERIIRSRKTFWGALLEFFIVAVILSAIMETLIGLLINQPDEFGKYPWWDNSQLPGNILGQGWIVNDIVIGFMAVLYLWVFYPLIYRGLAKLPSKVANGIFILGAMAFGAAIVASYGSDWLIFLGLA